MAWMTAGECANWWRDLLAQGGNSLYAKMETNGVGADTVIGFQLTWGAGCLGSIADMFLFDPLRLGEGTGAAMGDTRPGFRNSAVRVLNVIADLGRATAFLPFGKLTRIEPLSKAREKPSLREMPLPRGMPARRGMPGCLAMAGR